MPPPRVIWCNALVWRQVTGSRAARIPHKHDDKIRFVCNDVKTATVVVKGMVSSPFFSVYASEYIYAEATILAALLYGCNCYASVHVQLQIVYNVSCRWQTLICFKILFVHLIMLL